MPTPTVNLAGWMTIQTLGTLKPAEEIYLAACVAGNYEKHRRRQNVPFSHDGSYGRSVSMVKVDVLVPGSVETQRCYKLRLMYLTRELAPFCYDDPYCSSGLGGDYWETSVPVFRLMQLIDSWALPQ